MVNAQPKATGFWVRTVMRSSIGSPKARQCVQAGDRHGIHHYGLRQTLPWAT